MKPKVVVINWLAVFWMWCYSAQAAPAENPKGKDDFVFLLPAGEGGSNLFSGISVNLEPPTVDAFRNARDSYGNPVSPYGAAENGDKTLNAAGLQFPIPSYASGITEIRKPTDELLPPLVSSEVPADALQIPVVAQPSVELLPPLDSNNFANTPTDAAVNEVAGRPASESPVVPDSKSSEEEHSKQKSDGDSSEKKYTGGFGGSSGVLGDQKEKGFVIKDKEDKSTESSGKEGVVQGIPVTATESIPSPTLPSFDPAQKPLESSTQYPTAINSVFSPSIAQIETLSQQGVPRKPNAEASVPSPLSSSESTPTQQGSPALTARFDSDKPIQSPPSTVLPKTPDSLPRVPLGPGFTFSGPLFPVQPINNGPGKYTGGFGGPSGVLGNQAKPGYAIQPDGSIKDPDYTYRPPVGGVAPTSAPAPPPVLTEKPAAPPVKYEKYNGGFGGPPGILLPFDKH